MRVLQHLQITFPHGRHKTKITAGNFWDKFRSCRLPTRYKNMRQIQYWNIPYSTRTSRRGRPQNQKSIWTVAVIQSQYHFLKITSGLKCRKMVARLTSLFRCYFIRIGILTRNQTVEVKCFVSSKFWIAQTSTRIYKREGWLLDFSIRPGECKSQKIYMRYGNESKLNLTIYIKIQKGRFTRIHIHAGILKS